jgi:anti-sigma regulatory factor (Ser/Thr protein kinase)
MRNEAPYFDPNQIPEPDMKLPLEQRPLGGMGIHLIRNILNQMIYRALPQGGNELILVKKVTFKKG